MRRICNEAVKLDIYAPLEFVFYEGEQAAGMCALHHQGCIFEIRVLLQGKCDEKATAKVDKLEGYREN